MMTKKWLYQGLLNYRGREGTLGADNIPYLNRGVSYMGVYIHKTSSVWTLKIMYFICEINF